MYIDTLSEYAVRMRSETSPFTIQTLYPLLFSWHCMNHRLELAVADAMKDVSAINHLSAFLIAFTVFSVCRTRIKAL